MCAEVACVGRLQDWQRPARGFDLEVHYAFSGAFFIMPVM